MILAAESRKVDMKEVLAHPLGPLPRSLANSDGTLRKTNKAAFAKEMEKRVIPAETILTPSAIIIDGMSMVQKINGSNKTFSQLAKQLLLQAIQEGSQSTRIDIVFDVYRLNSIKNAETVHRGETSTAVHKKLYAGQRVQQWKRFLSSSANKTSLIKFFAEQWKQPEYRRMLTDKMLFVTCDTMCFKLTEDNCEQVPQLFSNQEEADTRLLLHAVHATSMGTKAIIIGSEDTDVMVLCLALQKQILCSMFQKRGTQNRARYVSINNLANSLGDGVCNSLIGLYAFTGCDAVSSFSGQGNVTALKLLLKEDPFQETFCEMGKTWIVNAEQLKAFEKFTCSMNAANINTTDVNKLRLNFFAQKKAVLNQVAFHRVKTVSLCT